MDTGTALALTTLLCIPLVGIFGWLSDNSDQLDPNWQGAVAGLGFMAFLSCAIFTLADNGAAWQGSIPEKIVTALFYALAAGVGIAMVATAVAFVGWLLLVATGIVDADRWRPSKG